MLDKADYHRNLCCYAASGKPLISVTGVTDYILFLGKSFDLFDLDLFFDCSIKMSWLGMLVYCRSPSLSGVTGIKEVATCTTHRPSIISATFYIREQLKCGQSNSKASLLRFL